MYNENATRKRKNKHSLPLNRPRGPSSTCTGARPSSIYSNKDYFSLLSKYYRSAYPSIYPDNSYAITPKGRPIVLTLTLITLLPLKGRLENPLITNISATIAMHSL